MDSADAASVEEGLISSFQLDRGQLMRHESCVESRGELSLYTARGDCDVLANVLIDIVREIRSEGARVRDIDDVVSFLDALPTEFDTGSLEAFIDASERERLKRLMRSWTEGQNDLYRDVSTTQAKAILDWLVLIDKRKIKLFRPEGLKNAIAFWTYKCSTTPE